MFSLWDMTILELHKRLPRSSVRPGTWGSAVSRAVRGDLGITVRASLRGVPAPSSTVGMEWDLCRTGYTTVSFGAPTDDQMPIAASEGSLSLSGDDDPAAFFPSGVVALSETAQR